VKRTAIALGLAAGLALARPAFSGEPRWIEVKSPHFTVITGAGEKTGRRMAWQFEQVRTVLQQVWPWALASRRPVVIFAVGDEATLKSLAPVYWETKRYRPDSVWVTGRDKHYTALRTDQANPNDRNTNPYFDAYRAYVGIVLDATFPASTPTWFERGLSEVMANTVVRDKNVDIGLPVSWHLELLQRSGRLSLADMFAVKRGSRYLTQEADAQVFTAQCWALVHYLMFGEQGSLSPKFNRLAQLLRDGKEPEVSFRETLGDPKAYEPQLGSYITRRVMQYRTMDLDVDINQAGFSARPLTPPAAAAARAGFHAAMNRPVEARALIDEAKRGEPQNPAPWEVEGLVSDGEGKQEEARNAFAKAAELGSDNAYVHYRLAQLLWTDGAAPEAQQRIAASLEKAIQIDPGYANALSFLADVRVEQGAADEALKLASKAVELEPNAAYHRLALARVLLRLQRRPEARSAAQQALALSDSDWERQNAQQLLDFISRLPPAATP
jgi:Flp pilus assembly protein TadD